MKTRISCASGAGVARKGWLEKKDVINTLPLEALLAELKGKRQRMVPCGTGVCIPL